MKVKHTRTFGVITVMVALMLSGVLSLGTLVLEAGRLQVARTQLSDANASAAMSMIASYNSDLFARYGLLAIDNKASNNGRYRSYLEFNSDLTTGYNGNNLATFYLVNSTSLQGMYNLTYPSVLKRQVLSRAKYNIIPQDFTLNYYNMQYYLADMVKKAQDMHSDFTAVANNTCDSGSVDDIPVEMQEALSAMYTMFSDYEKFNSDYDVTLDDTSVSLLPSSTGTITSVMPQSDIDAINEAVSDAKSVIGTNGDMLAQGATDGYKETDVSADVNGVNNIFSKMGSVEEILSSSDYIATQCRKLLSGVNIAVSSLDNDKESNVLLNSYIASYFPSRSATVDGYEGPRIGVKIDGDMPNLNFSGACVEYVIGGSVSETANQQLAYDYVFTVRFINNLHSVINISGFYNNQNSAIVATHIAWAYYETLIDMVLLADYNATIPYYKYNQIIPVNDHAAVKEAFSSENFINAMEILGVLVDDEFIVEGSDKSTYRDAMAMALWLVPNSEKMLRLADLVQLEMRYNQQYIKNEPVDFLMSEQNTFCRVECTANLNAVLPIISLGSNSTIDGVEFSSIKYVGY